MSPFERRSAVRQLAAMLAALHHTPCPSGLPAIDTPQLLGAQRLRRAGRRAPPGGARPGRRPALRRPVVIEEARRIVFDTADSIEPFDVPTLVHGDLHFENVLWDGTTVTTLLDFEWCRPAPPDLDLDVFLRFCAYPFLHVAEDYEHLTRAEDYEPVVWWLAEDYPGLFATGDAFARTRLYSIAYDVHELLRVPAAAAAPGAVDLPPPQPAGGDGGGYQPPRPVGPGEPPGGRRALQRGGQRGGRLGVGADVLAVARAALTGHKHPSADDTAPLDVARTRCRSIRASNRFVNRRPRRERVSGGSPGDRTGGRRMTIAATHGATGARAGGEGVSGRRGQQAAAEISGRRGQQAAAEVERCRSRA